MVGIQRLALILTEYGHTIWEGHTIIWVRQLSSISQRGSHMNSKPEFEEWFVFLVGLFRGFLLVTVWCQTLVIVCHFHLILSAGAAGGERLTPRTEKKNVIINIILIHHIATVMNIVQIKSYYCSSWQSHLSLIRFPLASFDVSQGTWLLSTLTWHYHHMIMMILMTITIIMMVIIINMMMMMVLTCSKASPPSLSPLWPTQPRQCLPLLKTHVAPPSYS